MLYLLMYAVHPFWDSEEKEIFFIPRRRWRELTARRKGKKGGANPKKVQIAGRPGNEYVPRKTDEKEGVILAGLGTQAWGRGVAVTYISRGRIAGSPCGVASSPPSCGQRSWPIDIYDAGAATTTMSAHASYAATEPQAVVNRVEMHNARRFTKVVHNTHQRTVCPHRS